MNTKTCALAGLLTSLVSPLTAAQSPAEIRAGLAAHDRALHVMDGWVRDPYIILGPDGSYYYTGTMPSPNDPREKSEPLQLGPR